MSDLFQNMSDIFFFLPFAGFENSPAAPAGKQPVVTFFTFPA
jgi:hypothetical protein